MAEPSIPVSAPALGRKKKNVLIPFGGKSQLDANRRLFEWSALHLFEPGDNVFVFHFHRKSAFKSVTAIAGGASSTAAATTDAEPKRPGFTVINIDSPLPYPHPEGGDTKPTTTATTTEAAERKAEEGKEEEKHVESPLEKDAGANDPAEVEWLPRAVSDALRRHRAASPSSFVVVFQMDSIAGPNSAEVSSPSSMSCLISFVVDRRCLSPLQLEIAAVFPHKLRSTRVESEQSPSLSVSSLEQK